MVRRGSTVRVRQRALQSPLRIRGVFHVIVVNFGDCGSHRGRTRSHAVNSPAVTPSLARPGSPVREIRAAESKENSLVGTSILSGKPFYSTETRRCLSLSWDL